MVIGSDDSLAVVVVTHNSSQWIGGLLSSWGASLARAGWSGERTPDLIVADSGSTDETVAVTRKLAPQANVITMGNVGYGTAANRAMGATSAKWVLLCNPDLTFGEEFARSFLTPLLRGEKVWLERTAVVAPRLLNTDGTVQASVGRFPSLGGLVVDQFRRRPMRKYVLVQPKEECEVDWMCGACLLLRRQAVLDIGGFDPLYFLYGEEVELEYRLAKAGWNRWFMPSAAVVHHAPNASRAPRPQVQRFAARGLLRYFAQHGTVLQLLACRVLILLARGLPPGETFAARAKILARSTGDEEAGQGLSRGG